MLAYKPVRAVIFLLWAAWSSTSYALDAMDEYLDLSARYSHGDFDSNLGSRLYQLQFTYGKFFDRFDASISSSYIFLSDELGNDTGIGDIYLHAGTVLSNRRNLSNELYGSIEVKLPTADVSTGLGTGETDLGFFLNYTHRIHATSLMLIGGYTFNGDSRSTRYQDVFNYGIGVSTYFDRWYLYGRIEGQQQRLSTGSNPLLLSGGLFYRLQAARFIKLEITSGLNDASADFGMIAGYVVWF